MDPLDSFDRLLGQALAQFHDRRIEEAAATYRQAAELRPSSEEALNGLSACSYLLGRYEEALDAMDRLIAIAPGNAPYWASKAVCLGELGRPEESLPAARAALERDAGCVEAANAEIGALGALGRTGELPAAFLRARGGAQSLPPQQRARRLAELLDLERGGLPARDRSAVRKLLVCDVDLRALAELSPAAGEGPLSQLLSPGLRTLMPLAFAASAGENPAPILEAALENPSMGFPERLLVWAALRRLGRFPSGGPGRELLGVVLELHLDDGLDTLAVYPDGGCRHLHRSGNFAVIPAGSDTAANEAARRMLDLARPAVEMLEPGEPVPPASGRAAFLLMTPAACRRIEIGLDEILGDTPLTPSFRAAREVALAIAALAG